ncbi:MAG: gamma-glutamyltransferase, partial [Alphaproteobacteria bacterium]|nr:gamma-glutamyltransferase [Alphaproteobacteria bacterium]
APAGSDAGDTTYFCIVDAAGHAVSAIQSLCLPFGAAYVAGDTGVLLNNRMTQWSLADGHPNRLEPGKRVRHTMAAPFVLRDGRLWAVFGTPGADNQLLTHLHTLAGLIDFGLDPQRVLESPRAMIMPPRRRAGVARDDEEILAVERDIGADALAGLAERGHRVAALPERAGSGSVALIRLLDNGVRMAASDPRMDGWAAAC